MTNRENETQHVATIWTRWTRKHEYGSIGMTYRAAVIAGDDEWKLRVYQTRIGKWVAQGRRDGANDRFYRDGFRTLRAAKAAVQVRLYGLAQQ